MLIRAWFWEIFDVLSDINRSHVRIKLVDRLSHDNLRSSQDDAFSSSIYPSLLQLCTL